MAKKKKKKKSNVVLNAFIAVAFLAGAGIFLYPTIMIRQSQDFLMIIMRSFGKKQKSTMRSIR